MSTVIQIMSVEMGIVVCYVRQIPNQPIVFKVCLKAFECKCFDLFTCKFNCHFPGSHSNANVLRSQSN